MSIASLSVSQWITIRGQSKSQSDAYTVIDTEIVWPIADMRMHNYELLFLPVTKLVTH